MSLLVHLFKVKVMMWHILYSISCLTCTLAGRQHLVHILRRVNAQNCWQNPGLIELERKHRTFDGIAASIAII